METGRQIKLWETGDWNAFFGLGTNALVNLMVLTGLLLYVVEMPAELVFGRIVPAVGLMIFLGNIYYAYMARRLALKTGRTDVTAMPSGPSVPHMFIVVLVIMMPIKIQTGDPVKAWEAGQAWVFLEGFVLYGGAFAAPIIRRITPRAALLGTLAGVSIAFISMRPAMEMYMTPIVGLVSLTIILAGWYGGVRFPRNAPAGLIAILVGSALAWASYWFGWGFGSMSGPALRESIANIGFSIPLPAVGHVFSGFEHLAFIAVTAIPFGVYDFIEAMDNVESASAAGDEYSTKEVLLVEGTCSLIGTMLGSPFANAVYIGHPGWKGMGGRVGYSAATGLLVLSVSILGIISFLLNVIPVVAILPILLYIGILITAQAFQATPRSHAPAVALALVPHLAAWAKVQVDGALGAAGTNAGEVGLEALTQQGVLYNGLAILGDGAILTGLVLGAILVFVIERQAKVAAAFALAGAILAYFGFMHGPAIGLGVSPAVAIGYLLAAILLFYFESLGKSDAPEHD